MREKRIRAGLAVEEQISREREQRNALLDRLSGIIDSNREQLDLHDDALEKLGEKYTTSQRSNAALHLHVANLLNNQSKTQRDSDETIASLHAQLEERQRQHEDQARIRAWEISVLQDEMHENDEEYATLLEIATSVVEDIEKKEMRVESLTAQLDQRNGELSTLRAAHAELEDAHQSLQHGFAAAKEGSATVRIS